MTVGQLRRVIEHIVAEGARQQKPYSCGAACVRFISDLIGDHVSEPEAMDLGRTSSKNGTEPEGVRDALADLGIRSRIAKRLTNDQITDTISGGDVLVLDVTMWDGAHWVVAHGLDPSGNIMVMDPGLGKSRPIDPELLDALRWRHDRNRAGSHLRGGLVVKVARRGDT